MSRPTRSTVLALVAAGMLVAVSCGQVANREHGPERSPSTAPGIAPMPGIVELRPDGLADFAFGRPMVEVLPGLVGLLGEPREDIRMHGDIPFGYGGMETTARVVTFDGLEVVFHDWSGYFRDDGVMHLVAWGAEGRGVRRSPLVLRGRAWRAVGLDREPGRAALRPGCGGHALVGGCAAGGVDAVLAALSETFP